MTVRKMSYSTAAKQARSNRISGFIPVGWAVVDGTTGSPVTGQYKQDGTKYKYYKFNGSGSITFKSAGIVDVLVVSGGGGGSSGTGGGGGVVWKITEVTKGQTIAIGVGGGGGNGGTSSFGSLVKIGGGQGSTTGDITSGLGGGGGMPGDSANGGGSGGTVWGANSLSGITLSYDNNTAIEYGASGGGTANRGAGGSASSTGGSGVVIVRVGA